MVWMIREAAGVTSNSALHLKYAYLAVWMAPTDLPLLLANRKYMREQINCKAQDERKGSFDH